MRENAFLVAQTLLIKFAVPLQKSLEILAKFPGTTRRFEKLLPGLYTDYAHHPTEIRATLDKALEINPNVVVVYQPHQNLRQYAISDEYRQTLVGAKKIYWLPTYLTRENDSPILTPQDLIAKLANKDVAEVADLNENLINDIHTHLAANDLVLIMGAGPIDNWARKNVL
jgi:UDP-N-acetylmuramate--alanine ligase